MTEIINNVQNSKVIRGNSDYLIANQIYHILMIFLLYRETEMLLNTVHQDKIYDTLLMDTTNGCFNGISRSSGILLL